MLDLLVLNSAKATKSLLAEGTYQGAAGVFLRLREDAKWTDITARDGSVRSHPMAPAA